MAYDRDQQRLEDEERRSALTKHRDSDPPCKACPQCYLIAYNGIRLCPECGYEFYLSKAVDNNRKRE